MLAAFRHGFTLIELSIVLVVIALIVGGILVGRDLIKGAEIRAQVSQLNQVNVAVNTFRLKYNAIPGDMANATYYWGLIDADIGNCLTWARTGTATCDGDGNGIISSPIPEHFLIWQHIENAGMIAQHIPGGSGPEYIFLKGKLANTYVAVTGSVTGAAYLVNAFELVPSPVENGDSSWDGFQADFFCSSMG